jgi:hypothetical protein
MSEDKVVLEIAMNKLGEEGCNYGTGRIRTVSFTFQPPPPQLPSNYGPGWAPEPVWKQWSTFTSISIITFNRKHRKD